MKVIAIRFRCNYENRHHLPPLHRPHRTAHHLQHAHQLPPRCQAPRIPLLPFFLSSIERIPPPRRRLSDRHPILRRPHRASRGAQSVQGKEIGGGRKGLGVGRVGGGTWVFDHRSCWGESRCLIEGWRVCLDIAEKPCSVEYFSIATFTISRNTFENRQEMCMMKSLHMKEVVTCTHFWNLAVWLRETLKHVSIPESTYSKIFRYSRLATPFWPPPKQRGRIGHFEFWWNPFCHCPTILDHSTRHGRTFVVSMSSMVAYMVVLDRGCCGLLFWDRVTCTIGGNSTELRTQTVIR